MELCYDGALVMPSNYAVMDEEEMTYVEGGGTFTVKASASTCRKIIKSGLVCVVSIINYAMGVGFLTNMVANCLGSLIFDFLVDVCGVKYQAFKRSFKRDWLPTYTLNLSKYV